MLKRKIILLSLLAFSFGKAICQEAKKDTSVVLFFGGDVTFADYFEGWVRGNIQYAFSNMDWYADADISMVNLENPITITGQPVDKKFNFKARPEYANILTDGGIDIVTIANNHIYDYGPVGLINTIKFLSQKNIQYIGAGRDINEARHPVIFYIKGLRIAYFAYYGTHKHSDSYPATIDSAGTALRQLPIIREDIQKYRKDVDFIIVNFHWGDEKANYPGKDQVYFAHQVINYGADIIVGHHPHVLQGVELYKGKIIAYSLGNFIFGGNSRKYYDSAILKIELNGKDSVSASLIPIEVKYWQPNLLKGNKADELMSFVKKLSSVFEKSIF